MVMIIHINMYYIRNSLPKWQNLCLETGSIHLCAKKVSKYGDDISFRCDKNRCKFNQILQKLCSKNANKKSLDLVCSNEIANVHNFNPSNICRLGLSPDGKSCSILK